jgi:hypothetical protein
MSHTYYFLRRRSVTLSAVRQPQITRSKVKLPFAFGGVISPCLSNIFLHHVLDEWFENEVKPRLKGNSTLVRFADDGAPRRREEEVSM